MQRPGTVPEPGICVQEGMHDNSETAACLLIIQRLQADAHFVRHSAVGISTLATLLKQASTAADADATLLVLQLLSSVALHPGTVLMFPDARDICEAALLVLPTSSPHLCSSTTSTSLAGDVRADGRPGLDRQSLNKLLHTPTEPQLTCMLLAMQLITVRVTPDTP